MLTRITSVEKDTENKIGNQHFLFVKCLAILLLQIVQNPL